MAKRKADAQLRREDLERESDEDVEETNVSNEQGLTCAAPDILATRKIKVAKRTLKTQSGSTFNPFASINLTGVKLSQPSLSDNVKNDSTLTPSLMPSLPKLGLTTSSVIPQLSLSPTAPTSNSDSSVINSAISSSPLKTSHLESNDKACSDTQFDQNQTDEVPKDTSQTSAVLPINGEKLKASRSSSPKRALPYYTKLTKLNQAFYNWIKEFMEESPDYDYSPVCQDYLKHIEKLKKDFPLKSKLKEEEKSITELLDKADEKNASDTSEMTEESEESEEIEESDEEESSYKHEYLEFVKNINSELLDKDEEHDEHDESFESEPMDESDSESFESSSKSSPAVSSPNENESSPAAVSESKVTIESKLEENKDDEYNG